MTLRIRAGPRPRQLGMTVPSVPWKSLEVASQTGLWYHSGKHPVPIRWVLIRDPLGQFRPQALLSTHLAATPVQIVEWFVLRWQLEVTFQEVRAHWGVETQRQWSDRAIARTTPALFGLFSWVSLVGISGGYLWQDTCPTKKARPFPGRQLGMPSRSPPLPMPSPWSEGTCGRPPEVFPCRIANLKSQKSPRHCSTALSARSPTPPECTKSSLVATKLAPVPAQPARRSSFGVIRVC